MVSNKVLNTIESSQSPISRYYFYQATMSQGFIAPIMIEYILSRGISFFQVGVLTSIFMATWLVAEIPAGYFADRFSRKIMLILSSFLTIVAMLLFGLSQTFLAFLIAYIIWGISIVFRSGIDTAWLYDLLSESSEQREFSTIQGRAKGIQIAVAAVTALVGAWLATENWVYPFVANSGLYLISIVAVIRLPKITKIATSNETFTIIDAPDVISGFLSDPPLSAFVIYTGMFFGLYGVAATFTQPVATDAGLEITHLGVLYAGFGLLGVITYYSGYIEQVVGVRTWFLTVPFVVGVLFILAPLHPVIAIFVLFAVRAGKSVSDPLREQYLNDRMETFGRATILSTVMMVSTFFMILFRIVGGFIAEYIRPVGMLAILSGGMIVCMLILFAIQHPFPQKVTDPKKGSPSLTESTVKED